MLSIQSGWRRDFLFYSKTCNISIKNINSEKLMTHNSMLFFFICIKSLIPLHVNALPLLVYLISKIQISLQSWRIIFFFWKGLKDMSPCIAMIPHCRFFGCGLPFPAKLEGCRVLDLGSGSGRDCFAFSKLVGPSGHVTGIDMTDQLVRYTQSRVQ